MHHDQPRFSTLLAALLCAPLGIAHAGLDDLFKSAGGLFGGAGSGEAPAAAVAPGLSDSQIGAGLREALSVGAERAVAVLGQQGGFLNDPSVRVPLPGVLGTAARGLRAAGQGQYVDQFETAVNRAAEQAVPQTLDIVKQTVRDMTLQDVRGILAGGDDAATRFLRERAGGSMRDAVLPIVAESTDNAGATAAYKSLRTRADQALGGFGALGGLFDTGALDLDAYVTDKTLDGLFLKLAAEERKIRENPVARSTDLLKTVFGR
jgi:hypothetical protein